MDRPPLTGQYQPPECSNITNSEQRASAVWNYTSSASGRSTYSHVGRFRVEFNQRYESIIIPSDTIPDPTAHDGGVKTYLHASQSVRPSLGATSVSARILRFHEKKSCDFSSKPRRHSAVGRQKSDRSWRNIQVRSTTREDGADWELRALPHSLSCSIPSHRAQYIHPRGRGRSARTCSSCIHQRAAIQADATQRNRVLMINT